MKIEYIEKRFSNASCDIIKQTNKIINEYAADGLRLTLRQLYYQFVSRDLISNTQKEYKRLGGIISNGRLSGAIDWMAIEDRTRNLKTYYHNTDPGDAVQDALNQFQLNKWENQPCRIEVWIEKEALVGVISDICRQLDVPYFACKGYVSQSELWSAAQRMVRYSNQGQTPVIIHLGDHDPSGIDMTRDIEERHNLFMKDCNHEIEVKRIALNMNQIETYKPPPNPAKLTDTRAKGYIEKHGKSSWELDALEPRVMRDLIKDTVGFYRDDGFWEHTIKKENEYRKVLKNVADNWQSL